jgi:hypothetical protein
VLWPPFIDVPVPTGQFLPDTCPQLAEGTDAHVHTVLSSLPVSDGKLEEVITATVADPQLSMLSHVVLAGWPESRKECLLFVLYFGTTVMS